MKDNKIMVRLDRGVYKTLQQLKLNDGYKSVSDVIKMLVDDCKKG
jgi:predicted CopG family antitoxin